MRTIQQHSLTDQVYETLKKSITRRQIAPDEKLDVNEMVKKLGVSRMPIMEALARLCTEGLVTRRNRVGTYVASLNRAAFEELFEGRDMVEQWATEKIIARLRDSDLKHLSGILRRAGELLDNVTDKTFDHRRFRELDQQFHLSLVRLCGNTKVIEFYISLDSHMQIARIYSLRALARSTRAQKEHEAILAGFAARDIKRARSAQHYHVAQSLESILKLLEEYKVL